MKQTFKPRRTVNDYATHILQGDRVALGQAITLVESNLDEDQKLATQLIESIIDKTGNSIRIGITGVPGVGKSTFIESFGKHIISQHKKVAVLTIDPSSQLTKGSILGDKTRMEDLSKNPMAFIRPTSSGNMLGGVATKTREVMLLCEAAGYNVIIIETVGVGQSEVMVKSMVDFFLLLMLAGAGDELQGIKKGIMEMADGLVITKADGDNIKNATAAKSEYQGALHLYPLPASGWNPKVLTCSARTNAGIDETWKMIEGYHEFITTSGYFNENRKRQNIVWLHEHFEFLLKADLARHSKLKNDLSAIEESVSEQRLSPQSGAYKLLQAYHDTIQGLKS